MLKTLKKSIDPHQNISVSWKKGRKITKRILGPIEYQ